MKLLLVFVFVIYSNLTSAEESWGSVNYKTQNIAKSFEENDRVLSIAHKVQCRYFSTHKENSLKNQRAAKSFKDNKEDIAKLDDISKKIRTFTDSYCGGKENLNPESMAGVILSNCHSACLANFKSSLEFIGKYKTDKTIYCENSCHEFVSPFQEISKSTIEADNIFRSKNEDTHDCAGVVDGSRRGSKAKIFDGALEKERSFGSGAVPK